jgi:hypothetical protein
VFDITDTSPMLAAWQDWLGIMVHPLPVLAHGTAMVWVALARPVYDLPAHTCTSQDMVVLPSHQWQLPAQAAYTRTCQSASCTTPQSTALWGSGNFAKTWDCPRCR